MCKFLQTTYGAKTRDLQHPVTNHYSMILKNVGDNKKETNMHNYATNKRMNLKKRRETRQQKKNITNLSFEQIEARHANARSHYANVKRELRQAIRDRQRLLYANMTASKNKQREIMKKHVV
jgi:hypothetical protein